ncbi:MAG: hypothetical protein P4L72_08420 [Parvibaculum sp.]|uniref:hypothetical protein n=1 Tax=Parvibaculum sp. TaxID=2024848 RepID=UPI0028434055|nr:hypothetical protein [Parvibaculum sp.]MDR3499236.1 hypothetical protein [Parvibaculum sp.]
MSAGSRFLFCAYLLLALALAPQARAAGFTGNFNGIANAAGMTLNLQEAGGRVVGRLAAGGQDYAVVGARSDKGAQGSLRVGGGAADAAFFRMEERPLGVQFLFIPAKADGKPDLDAAREYSFLAQGVAVPSQSRYLAAPPASEKIDVLRFIDEYRQWDPRDVARIYSALDERSQGLIQLYDHATADLLWRICSTNPPNENISQAKLDELLDRQHIACADFMPLVAAAQKGGLFPEFLRRARFQFEIVRETVLCNRGQSSTSKCADVSALGAPLIVHWRDAASIMRELAGDAAVAANDNGNAGQGAMTPYPTPQAPAAPVAAPVSVPLRATIADEPTETRSAAIKWREGRAVAKARRRGVKLPLADPRA